MRCPPPGVGQELLLLAMVGGASGAGGGRSDVG